MNQIVSFSGGKDSTAMLHMMLERGEEVHSAAWFDGGWEFPDMHDHIEEVRKKTGVTIVRLTPPQSFDYWMYEREIVARKGPMKGKVHRIGNGWPSPMRRWCTREKINAISKYQKTVQDAIMCIGFAAGEERRLTSLEAQKTAKKKRYPLMEWEKTEEDCLAYCRKLGYTWGGLYDVFSRVSCFCCPLQSLKELRLLRHHYPDLWARMKEMDTASPSHNKGFKGYKSVHDLDRRFADEDRQRCLSVANRPTPRMFS